MADADPRNDVLAALRLGRGKPAVLDGRRPQPVGWAMGCALLARRDAVRAAGGFDEGYFMYSEEVDLLVRLGATHWVPEAEVMHEGQASTGDSPERAVEMARSRRRYQRATTHGAVARSRAPRISVQFALLALAARLRGGPGGRSGCRRRARGASPAARLRERAEAFNAGRR